MTDRQPLNGGTGMADAPRSAEGHTGPLKADHVIRAGSKVVEAATRSHMTSGGTVSLPRAFRTRVQAVEPRHVAGQTYFEESEEYFSD